MMSACGETRGLVLSPMPLALSHPSRNMWGDCMLPLGGEAKRVVTSFQLSLDSCFEEALLGSAEFKMSIASKDAKPHDPLATVTVHALCGGHFSLPEEQFVSPSEPGARKTVPSLCFLIQHKDPETGEITRIIFDLGLRRDVDRYSEPIRRHVKTRRPLSTDPDVAKSLAAGGLTPDGIDYVIYSHVILSL